MARARALDLTDLDDATRERFWSKVDVRSSDECWEWQGARKPSGYGQFALRPGSYRSASRIAYALTAPIPEGLFICHHCDNPPCCNPAHLFAGTSVENVNDCIAKGRGNRASGESHPAARLTAEQVAYIRSQDVSKYGRRAELAREFGLGSSTIYAIFDGTTWGTVA